MAEDLFISGDKSADIFIGHAPGSFQNCPSFRQQLFDFLQTASLRQSAKVRPVSALNRRLRPRPPEGSSSEFSGAGKGVLKKIIRKGSHADIAAAKKVSKNFCIHAI